MSDAAIFVTKNITAHQSTIWMTCEVFVQIAQRHIHAMTQSHIKLATKRVYARNNILVTSVSNPRNQVSYNAMMLKISLRVHWCTHVWHAIKQCKCMYVWNLDCQWKHAEICCNGTYVRMFHGCIQLHEWMSAYVYPDQMRISNVTHTLLNCRGCIIFQANTYCGMMSCVEM